MTLRERLARRVAHLAQRIDIQARREDCLEMRLPSAEGLKAALRVATDYSLLEVAQAVARVEWLVSEIERTEGSCGAVGLGPLDCMIYYEVAGRGNSVWADGKTYITAMIDAIEVAANDMYAWGDNGGAWSHGSRLGVGNYRTASTSPYGAQNNSWHPGGFEAYQTPPPPWSIGWEQAWSNMLAALVNRNPGQIPDVGGGYAPLWQATEEIPQWTLDDPLGYVDDWGNAPIGVILTAGQPTQSQTGGGSTAAIHNAADVAAVEMRTSYPDGPWKTPAVIATEGAGSPPAGKALSVAMTQLTSRSTNMPIHCIRLSTTGTDDIEIETWIAEYTGGNVAQVTDYATLESTLVDWLRNSGAPP